MSHRTVTPTISALVLALTLVCTPLSDRSTCLAASRTAGSADTTSATFYVAPEGEDDWSGRHPTPTGEAADGIGEETAKDGPFATIERARAAARALLLSQPERRRPVRIQIRGGTYRLEEPLRFGPEDSGTDEAPVIYEAYPGERPVISGGRTVTDWTRPDVGYWIADVGELIGGKARFRQLFINDQRRLRARLPVAGYHEIEARPETQPSGGDDRFVYPEGTVDPTWAERAGVEIVPFHFWSNSRLRIDSVDPETRTVRFTGSTWTNEWYGQLTEGHRFLVVGVREGLKEPGTWHLEEATGTLRYHPKAGEKPGSTTAVVPALETLVRLEGDTASGEPVRHIRFKGLTFAHTSWHLPREGRSVPQAAIVSEAAIEVVGAEHITIDRCAVTHTGGYGIAFGWGSRDNAVTESELVDLGAGGIKIGRADASTWSEVGTEPPLDLVPARHRITDNLIAHGGRQHPAGVGVWIGHSPHNTVARNTIRDLYYTGVSVGWSWGYEKSLAFDNRIRANRIAHIGRGVLSDMSGVYTLGISPGTAVTENYVHHVTSHDYGGWGLYTDEGSSYILMRDNLVHHTTTGGFHQHYGRANRITNNIFAFSASDQLQRTRAEDHLSFRFDHNVVYYRDGPLLGSNWSGSGFTMDHNLYWKEGGGPVLFPDSLSLSEWQRERNQDAGSRVADPGFVAPEDGDFRLSDGSPALELGFEPFNYRDAGRRQSPQLTDELPPVPAAFPEEEWRER